MGDRLFSLLIGFLSAIVFCVFCWLMADVIIEGVDKLNWKFLTTEPARSGREGGIYPIIVSTLLILLVALVVALPLGLSSAIWLSEYSQKGKLLSIMNTSLDVLAGVPSIVFGLFGYAFFCGFLGMGFSILSGGLTLACMMLPIFIRTSELGLSAVPSQWREAGAALGMSRATIIRHVVIPYASPAITAGMLLAIGRALAETAALIFTSGYVDRMPDSLHDSGRALAVHIYDLSMNVIGGDQAAYGSALVLIIMVVTINIATNALSEYWLAKKVSRN